LHRVATDQEFWLRPTGPAIGLKEGFAIRREDIELEPGDILLLYTDGLPDATDHQGIFWGEDKLADIIRQNADASAEHLIQKIVMALKDHTNGIPLDDDVTLMISKVS
jgi:sigma-B regulation protein RsbU (phosphoserine phosphatase)